MLRKPLNVITTVQMQTDNINRMIMIAELSVHIFFKLVWLNYRMYTVDGANDDLNSL